MNSDILTEIAKKVRMRLETRRKTISLLKLKELAHQTRRPHRFIDCFSSPGSSIIAEVKFGSPSLGRFKIEAGEKNAVQIARSYLESGASAISVLTEEDFFDGHSNYLRAIREEFPGAALLMKDFVIDEYQVYEARVLGADAVLLIVALLGEEKTKEFLRLAKTLGLDALVEVHNEEEMISAVKIKSELIGVNNRNLRTLKIDLETSKRLFPLASRDSILVCESGLESAKQIREMRELGFKGFLMGTSFMKTKNPGQTLAELLWDLR